MFTIETRSISAYPATIQQNQNEYVVLAPQYVSISPGNVAEINLGFVIESGCFVFPYLDYSLAKKKKVLLLGHNLNEGGDCILIANLSPIEQNTAYTGIFGSKNKVEFKKGKVLFKFVILRK